MGAVAYALSQQDSRSTGCRYFRGIAVHNGEKELMVKPISCWRGTSQLTDNFGLAYNIEEFVKGEGNTYVINLRSEGSREALKIDFDTEQVTSLQREHVPGEEPIRQWTSFNSPEGKEFLRSCGFFVNPLM